MADYNIYKEKRLKTTTTCIQVEGNNGILNFDYNHTHNFFVNKQKKTMVL